MINILIVDEIYIVRKGTETIARNLFGNGVKFDFAANDCDAISFAQGKEYDLIIMDLSMTGVNGLTLLKNVIDGQPEARIVLSTKQENDFYFDTAMMFNEVKAFICKSATEEHIIACMSHAIRGKRYIPEIQQKKLDEVYIYKKAITNPFESLSEREQKVAKLLLKGYGILEVGNELDITSSTASTYKSRIFRKLNVHNVIELNRYARKFRFIEEELGVN